MNPLLSPTGGLFISSKGVGGLITGVFIYGQLAWTQPYSRPLIIICLTKQQHGLIAIQVVINFTENMQTLLQSFKVCIWSNKPHKNGEKKISREKKIYFSNRLIGNNRDLTLFNSCQRVSHSFRSCNSAEMCPSDKWAVSCLSPVTSWSSSEVLTLNSKERRTTSTFQKQWEIM